jgi:2-polyprenyl-3-methyl-5-hydroxy-6-metoxy-1,4-benzoquinol methylase
MTPEERDRARAHAWRTATRRAGGKPSAPLSWALRQGLLRGPILDFGCGRGDDVEALRREGFEAEGYDPTHRPQRPAGRFRTVVCNYVVNVLPVEDEPALLEDLESYVEPGGAAYIATRRDISPEQEGFTRAGTFQRRVDLSRYPGVELVRQSTGYALWRWVRRS